MDRPIPAFYCCYLLRSTIRHQSLYVGSTPNPVRRLKQHNGDVKGGAVKTSRQSLRPWEMACLVVGFPSKIAALQFEWAWQNTHMTRHILPEDRISKAQSRRRASSPSRGGRRRPGRLRMSLTDKLANLHLLLNTKSFQRWPLSVNFYAQDVFKAWQRVSGKFIKPIVESEDSPRISYIDTLNNTEPLRAIDAPATSSYIGISMLDVTYKSMKASIEQSNAALSRSKTRCAVCNKAVNGDSELVLICPETGCASTSHLSCLSQRFPPGASSTDILLPKHGSCPKCEKTISWSDMVRDLTLRLRGQKEVAALFKPDRRRKGIEPRVANPDGSVPNALEAEDNADLSDDDDLADDWARVDEDSDVGDLEDSRQLAPTPQHSARTANPSSTTEKAEVIGDSDWEGVEVLG